MHFKEALKEAMEANKITGIDLAKSIGVSHTSVYRWLAGDAELYEKGLLDKLAGILPEPWGCRVTLAWLRDHCPTSCNHLLERPGLSLAEDSPKYFTPLDRALADLKAGAARNDDLRSLIFDLARMAPGL